MKNTYNIVKLLEVIIKYNILLHLKRFCFVFSSVLISIFLNIPIGLLISYIFYFIIIIRDKI